MGMAMLQHNSTRQPAQPTYLLQLSPLWSCTKMAVMTANAAADLQLFTSSLSLCPTWRGCHD